MVMVNNILHLPSYYSDYIEQKIAEINARMQALRDGDAFIYITDIHISSNAENSFPLMDELVRRTPIKKIIYNGDTPSAFGTKEQCLSEGVRVKSLFACITPDADIYMTRGNHDFTIRTDRTSADGYTAPRAIAYDLIMANQKDRVVGEDGLCYYYFDNADAHIRYIILDTDDGEEAAETQFWGVRYGIRQAQITWLIDTVQSAPAGWDLFVIGHIPIAEGLNSYDETVSSAAAVLEAVQNRRVLDDTQNLPEHDIAIRANADFRDCTNSVVAFLCGHNHRDAAVVRDHVLHISTCCDAYYRDDPNNAVRIPGTVSEQCFDVVIFDRDTHTLETIRIGAGKNRTFVLEESSAT